MHPEIQRERRGHDVAECDVCGDRTGTHKQFCGEGSGREDTREAVIQAAGIDPAHSDNDCFVYDTGGGGKAIVALLPDGRELWVTGLRYGTTTGPDREDPSDGWLVGLYPDHDAPYERPETMIEAQTHDQSLGALRGLIAELTMPWERAVALVVADQRESYPDMAPGEAIGHVRNTVHLPEDGPMVGGWPMEDDGSELSRAYRMVLTGALDASCRFCGYPIASVEQGVDACDSHATPGDPPDPHAVALVVDRIDAEVLPVWGIDAFRADPGGLLGYHGFPESHEVCAAAIERVLNRPTPTR